MMFCRFELTYESASKLETLDEETKKKFSDMYDYRYKYGQCIGDPTFAMELLGEIVLKKIFEQQTKPQEVLLKFEVSR
jgi:hypothetical protein